MNDGVQLLDNLAEASGAKVALLVKPCVVVPPPPPPTPPLLQVGEGNKEFHQPPWVHGGASWVVCLQVGWRRSPLEGSNMVGLPARITAHICVL
jgi:hypothetical protein